MQITLPDAGFFKIHNQLYHKIIMHVHDLTIAKATIASICNKRYIDMHDN